MASARQQIPLANLRLNKENDRHGALASEPDCIQWLLTRHLDHMLNLAKNIAEYGLSPIDSVLVLPAGDDAPDDYDVWEGNRRVAALKLLDDSNRCPDATTRRKFSTIRSQAKVTIPTKIECVVASSTEEADRLIELRHQGAQEGIGTVAWDPIQKDRHQQRLGKRGRYAFSNQVVEAVLDKVQPSIKQKIEDEGFPISTLDRILRNADTQKFLGLVNVSGEPRRTIEEKEMLKGLSKILADVAGGMHVSEVYTGKAIGKYLKKFEPKNTPNLKKVTSGPAPLTHGASSSIAKSTVRSKPLSHKRTKLIPTGVKYRISDRRINAIYHELRKLEIDNARNAVAVLHRVFLELSVDCYLEHFNITHSSSDKLANKAQKVVQHMKGQNWINRDESKGINSAIAGTHHPHSVDTFHAYVHNRKYSPVPSDLNAAFDNLQPFYAALFKNLP